ncbi:B3GA3-like protein [Mya arenaria]|uniref:Galactosylgalactosylxylosylprotein 3-beta-glucuronosyltransferase n=1 Tax=Mya arenaria TaxID=6604 RepID=A0ABY7FFW4_MYAAR|nr:B3GA3-like protein [Mya arenaria]
MYCKGSKRCVEFTKTESQKSQIEVLKRHKDELSAELKKLERRLDTLQGEDNSGVPRIYIITPTHNRLEQKADLTRLSYTLRLVPNIHWIVVEDADHKSDLVKNVLANSKLSCSHLFASTPPNVKLKETDPNWLKPRGVLQRNEALRWIRLNAKNSGVVYLADDDNTYDIRLFEEMRYTQKVSVWPVGLVGYLRYESPKVVGWHTYWKPQRKFAMDMAGFAVNLELIRSHPKAAFRMSAGRGNQESDLLTQLGLEMSDLEPRADDCTKNEEKMLKLYNYNSDPNIEV